MKYKLTFLFVLLFSCFSLWACPNCAGSPDEKYKYVVYILSAFIALTYVPFWIIFKLARKKQKKIS